ncbi:MULTISPECIES: FtsX-like permease family protein [Nocardioides]|uniref:FtsX-like permease family protein n=1 Tax=Nocardioides vastitatis TaxID=2568655 RepID=A0ABW0ZKV6_9ACTN|nr:FtsX-like permease family protein [Nocardioides sp.]
MSVPSLSATEELGRPLDLPSSGLTTADVALRRQRDGLNRLPEAPRPRPWTLLARQLTHLLAVLLWIGAGIALLAGMPQIAVAIVVIVVLNALFAFWQEYRADVSTERLRALLPTATRVMRNGTTTTIGLTELVIDDLVLLAAGDRIGADMVLAEAHGLALDESLVTGESGAVPRKVGDRLMAGTFVIAGEGRAVVVAVGERTTLAEIAAMTAEADRPPSPLTIQLSRVVKLLPDDDARPRRQRDVEARRRHPVNSAPGIDAARAKADIETALADYPNVTVNDPEDITEKAQDSVDQLLGIVTALLLLAVLVAILGIVNTLVLSVVERTRELGLLRAVGATRRQVRTVVRRESVLMAVLGALTGIALGTVSGVALSRALAAEGITTVAVPTGTLAVYLVIAAAIGVLAAIGPARRASKVDVLQAITAE